MIWWMRALHVAVLGAALLSPLASCGGSSSSDEDSAGSGMSGSGGSSGGASGSSGGAGGSKGGTGGSKGGSAGSDTGCLYNGVRYEPGQTFGDCDNCVCDEVLGVSCKMLACPSSGGSSGTAGTSGAPGGCDVDGKHVDEGASWAADCNSCYCKGSQVVCTTIACASGGAGGTGGAGGKGGSAGAGAIGAGGEAGSAPACEYAPIGSFCIVGKPTADGQELVEGMPLTVSLRPDGCYSSSCTKLVSVDCNYLGSDFVYYVSGFVCLATEGDVCTDDCGGGGNPVCEPGVTLTAGNYEVGIGGTTLAVKFTVPSQFGEGQLCAPALAL